MLKVIMNLISGKKDIDDNLNFGDKYTAIEKISSGSYGLVLKAINNNNKELVAIKVIKDGFTPDGLSANVWREIAIMNVLTKHPNCTSLLDVVARSEDNDDNFIALIMTLGKSDLDQWMRETSYHLGDIKRIMFQIFLAVNFIHGNYIIHRDIKPSNIIIDSNGIVRVTDFGLSRLMTLINNDRTFTLCGTKAFFAPELLFNSTQYDYSIDIWSMGVTFTELLGAKDPFIPSFDSDKNDDIQILKMIFEVLGTPHELQHPCLFKLFHEYQIQHKNLKGKDGKSYFNNIITCKPLKIIYNDDDGIELLMTMIELEANDRIKTEVALKSVFFKDINM